MSSARLAPRTRQLLRPAPARLLRPTPARSASTVAADAPVAQPSFFARAASFTRRALLFTTIGFIMAAAPALRTVQALRNVPTDAETVHLFEPTTPEELEKEAFINALHMVAELRANPDMVEARPHLKIPPSWRAQNLTGGVLIGPGRMVVPPFSWTEKGGKSYTQIMHVGTDLCGHVGIVHGGFLATLLDEGLARSCFDALPHKIGMTAKLEVNYKAPAEADQYLVLRATTRQVEGRKAWVDGRIETIPEPGQEPIVLAEATALYISPKQASLMAKVYTSSE